MKKNTRFAACLVLFLTALAGTTGCGNDPKITVIICAPVIVAPFSDDLKITCNVPGYGSRSGTVGEAKDLGFRVVERSDGKVELHRTASISIKDLIKWEVER